MPPGYLGLSSPPALRVLHYGVLSVSLWWLAHAAIDTNIPAVIGSAKSASFERAKYSLMPPTVITFPKGTFFHYLIIGCGRRKVHPVSSVFLYGSFICYYLYLRHIPAVCKHSVEVFFIFLCHNVIPPYIYTQLIYSLSCLSGMRALPFESMMDLSPASFLMTL